MESDSDVEDMQVERRERVFKQRINFYLDENEHKERFRIDNNMVNYVLSRINDRIQHSTKRNFTLDSRQQLLLCLRFLSSNGFYHLTGDAHGLHKSTVCRVIQSVVRAINDTIFNEVVKFPVNENTAQKFFAIANMPSVCGLIDGSLIKIQSPKEHEHQFVDRFGDHSINAMFVCGPNLEFLCCSARYPGSVHDSRVLRNSLLFDLFEHGWRPFPSAVILGDSGYPCNEWLIPPVRATQTQAEENFNRAHKSTRCAIERAFGCLKQRFSCLETTLRVKSPEFACEIIKCCTALHNLCIQFYGVPDDIPNNHVIVQEEIYNPIEAAMENFNRRQQLIQYFRDQM